MTKSEQLKKKYDKTLVDLEKLDEKRDKLEKDKALFWAEYITALQVEYGLSNEEFEARLKQPLPEVSQDVPIGGDRHV